MCSKTPSFYAAAMLDNDVLNAVPYRGGARAESGGNMASDVSFQTQLLNVRTLISQLRNVLNRYTQL